ncbi:hypothetical protein WKS98_09225, partial [Lagierella sp. ICN-221743]
NLIKYKDVWPCSSADCFNQSATPLGKQVASDLLELTKFAKLGLEVGTQHLNLTVDNSINFN